EQRKHFLQRRLLADARHAQKRSQRSRNGGLVPGSRGCWCSGLRRARYFRLRHNGRVLRDCSLKNKPEEKTGEQQTTRRFHGESLFRAWRVVIRGRGRHWQAGGLAILTSGGVGGAA